MAAPINRLTEVFVGPGEGVCDDCGESSTDALCDGCFNARWTPECIGCGGAIQDQLARLGSTRCQDCRDGLGQLSDFLRRAA